MRPQFGFLERDGKREWRFIIQERSGIGVDCSREAIISVKYFNQRGQGLIEEIRCKEAITKTLHHSVEHGYV